MGFLAASRSFLSSVVMFTEATMPWMTEMIVLTMATGAETIASTLKMETPRTAEWNKIIAERGTGKKKKTHRLGRVWSREGKERRRKAR